MMFTWLDGEEKIGTSTVRPHPRAIHSQLCDVAAIAEARYQGRPLILNNVDQSLARLGL